MTNPQLDIPANTGSSTTRWLGITVLAGIAFMFFLLPLALLFLTGGLG